MPDDIVQVVAAKNIGTLIRQVLPQARVHDWWVVATGIEPNLSLFTTIEEEEFVVKGTPFVHGYCIGIEDLPRSQSGIDLTFRDQTTLNVWGLYEYQLGNRQKNAEHVFAAHLKAIQDKISLAPRLQTDGNIYGEGDPRILGHQQLQWNNIIPQGYNQAKKKVFLARGSIVVDVTTQIVVA